MTDPNIVDKCFILEHGTCEICGKDLDPSLILVLYHTDKHGVVKAYCAECSRSVT